LRNVASNETRLGGLKQSAETARTFLSARGGDSSRLRADKNIHAPINENRCFKLQSHESYDYFWQEGMIRRHERLPGKSLPTNCAQILAVSNPFPLLHYVLGCG
jgi:hypothetical protein